MRRSWSQAGVSEPGSTPAPRERSLLISVANSAGKTARRAVSEYAVTQDLSIS